MKFLPEYNKRKLGGIYIIRNTIDSRVYIGECKNFYKRYGRHKSSLLLGKHCNIKLQSFVNKYGIGTLTFDILESMPNSTGDERIDREIYYIDRFDSINNGFNIIKDSRTMAHVNNNNMRKMGASKLKGIKRSKDFCENISKGLKDFYKNNPKQTRKKWTEERRQARRTYIKNNPDRYANRKPSSGNRNNHKCGEESSFTKLTNEIVYNIKKAIYHHVKRSDIIAKFNITVNIYKDIKRGKTWNSVVYEENTNKEI
jgi:group I intron endonuclease